MSVIDFTCKVCGVRCDIAPDPPERAVCPEHCDDHKYVYIPGQPTKVCEHCGDPVPFDYYDD